MYDYKNKVKIIHMSVPKLRLKIQQKQLPQHEIMLLEYREIARKRLSDSALAPELVNPLEDKLYQMAIREAEIEKCLNDPRLYTRLYMSVVRHFVVNLTRNNEINNEQFINDLNTGLLTIDKALELTPQEMHPERWRVLVEKKINDLNKMTRDPEATTDMFRCGKCRRNKCKYFERQDRSSDEPMTLHITCCYCGNKWRQ